MKRRKKTDEFEKRLTEALRSSYYSEIVQRATDAVATEVMSRVGVRIQAAEAGYARSLALRTESISDADKKAAAARTADASLVDLGLHLMKEDPALQKAALPYLEELKHVLPSGATRSEKAPSFHLVPPAGLTRTAKRFQLGAEKHGEGNWMLCLKDEESAYAFANEAYNHLLVHLFKMRSGADKDDDHLGSLGWTQTVLCHIEATFGKPWTELRGVTK